jgi:hypothetical protein
MNTINIYKTQQGKETFVPQGTSDPCAVVSCERSHEIDYEADRLIMPSLKGDPEFRASGVTLAARCEVFGFRFVEDNGFHPKSTASEAESKPRKGKK